MKKIFLVDTSSLFFRAFYAIRPLTSPSGMPTNAIYGFLSMIAKILKDEKPDFMVFCYDRKEPSFRKDIYPEYKANRSETPEDLIPQIPYIKRVAHALGIPSIEREKFEADDIIGTMTKLGRRHRLEVFIVSGDKDFAQVVEDHVWLFDTMKDVKLGAAGVKEKWGIEPNQMIDYLALIGDSSDNIPGVMGIGPKGAQKLLAEYGTLENIYKNVESVKGSIHDKLLAGKDSAFLSQKLVTISLDVPVPQDLESYHVKPIQVNEFKSLMEELNFKNFDRLLDLLPTTTSPAEAVHDIVVESVKGSSIESAAEPIPIVIKHQMLTNDFTLIEIKPESLNEQLEARDDVYAFLTEHGLFLMLEAKKKLLSLRGDAVAYGHALQKLNLKWSGFDLKKFWHAIEFQLSEYSAPEVQMDAMLAAYVIKAGEPMDFDRVCERFTGERPSDLNLPLEILNRHLRLLDFLKDKIKVIGAENVLAEIEYPLIFILYKMEKTGIQLDLEELKRQSVTLTHELKKAEQDIFEIAGENFNVASPKQLGHILFEKLKLPSGKKTKTGFSTDSDVLIKLSLDYPIAKSIIEFRETAKLKSTYVDSLPNLVKEDGRLHTTLNQALTATGRLSSTEPNLQNIPIRTPRGARIRQAFIPSNGKLFLSVDYSQIELRILAHYSDDKNMCQAFHDDLDIHAATASEVFSVPLKQVTFEMRRTAKAVNFGIAYGQGAFGLAENLGISRGEAADIIKKYFIKFPGVQNYIEETIRSAHELGYVETLYGRRRYMDDLKSGAAVIKKMAERAAINAPIQGTASDIVKLAMIKVAEKIKIPMILQVHDELIFEATKEDLVSQKSEIVCIMQSVSKLKVPLKANAAIGKNWDEAH